LIVILIALTIGLAVLMPGQQTAQVSAQGDFELLFPLFMSQGPLYSTSYYMITVDPDFTYDLGCELGTRDANEPGVQDNVVVLDFSYPVCNADNTYEAELFGFGPVGLTEVQAASQGFMLGYYECSAADTDSNLVLGIGTNNKPTSCDSGAKMTAHGAAWAGMVDDVNRWAVDNGLYGQVQAYGASDIEVGWNSPERSKDWLSGYGAANDTPLIHFGDAAGCPYDDMTGTTCGNGWTQEDVWYVAWGFPPSLPLPLIYLTNGAHAEQWARISQYAFANHGARMDFTGVFTQSQACEQWGCSGTDNTPSEAYQQLYDALNANPDTAQDLNWKTDIRWILREEAYPGIYRASGGSDTTLPGSMTTLIDGLETSLQAQVQVGGDVEDYLVEKMTLLEQVREQITAAQANPASKGERGAISLQVTAEPPFQVGIIEGGSIANLPYGASLTNVWQAKTEDSYLQVGAGLYPGDESQGALYILRTSADKSASEAILVTVPAGSGALRIVGELENGLRIKSESGAVYQFTFTDYGLESVTP
jgi:hypothetical protein